MSKTVKNRSGRGYAEVAIRLSPCPTPHKVPHASRAVAKKAKRQQAKRPGVTLSIYVCECGCYHVGSLAHVEHRSEARAIAKRKLRKKA